MRSRDVDERVGLAGDAEDDTGVRAPSFTTAQFPASAGARRSASSSLSWRRTHRPAVRTTRTSFAGDVIAGPSASRGAPVAESARGVE